MGKKKKKKEDRLPSKPLMASQVQLLTLLVQQFNQVNALWNEKKQAIDNAVAISILELGVPEAQIGEWGLAADGKSIVRYGMMKRPPMIGTTVCNRPKSKKKKKAVKDSKSQ